jgi:hypothetical protein
VLISTLLPLPLVLFFLIIIVDYHLGTQVSSMSQRNNDGKGAGRVLIPFTPVLRLFLASMSSVRSDLHTLSTQLQGVKRKNSPRTASSPDVTTRVLKGATGRRVLLALTL